jgi:hypothetical protein
MTDMRVARTRQRRSLRKLLGRDARSSPRTDPGGLIPRETRLAAMPQSFCTSLPAAPA